MPIGFEEIKLKCKGLPTENAATDYVRSLEETLRKCGNEETTSSDRVAQKSVLFRTLALFLVALVKKIRFSISGVDSNFTQSIRIILEIFSVSFFL